LAHASVCSYISHVRNKWVVFRSFVGSVNIIQSERVRVLNRAEIENRVYVLYWMQASQRTEYNHALEYAILRANELDKPLLVYFGLTGNYPGANARHYSFMLEGLKEVQTSLEARGVRMVIRRSSPEVGAVELSRDASLVVVDRGYLKIQRGWVSHVAEYIDCPLIQVETNVIVPVGEASPKEEYSAATIRPKIMKKLNYYLVPMRQNRVKKNSLHLDLDTLDIDDIAEIVSSLGIDLSVEGVTIITEELQRPSDIF